MSTIIDSSISIKQDIAERHRAIFDLLEHNEMLDDQGYPTDAALDVISLWHSADAKGWFKFVKSIWHLSDWGWKETDEPDERRSDNTMVHRYYVSTAGWSGNESIIAAMQANKVMWFLTWVQSRRGGHYIFELKHFFDQSSDA